MKDQLVEFTRRGFAARAESVGRRLGGFRVDAWVRMLEYCTGVDAGSWRRWCGDKRRVPPAWAWRILLVLEWYVLHRKRLSLSPPQYVSDCPFSRHASCTQETLALVLGVSRRTVIRWEIAGRYPSWACMVAQYWNAGWIPPRESHHVRNGRRKATWEESGYRYTTEEEFRARLAQLRAESGIDAELAGRANPRAEPGGTLR